jgi:hypothetical protein
MKTSGLLLTVLLACVTESTAVVAGWSDYLDQLKDAVNVPVETVPGVNLTEAEMVSGLKEALEKGTQFAVDSLGKDGDFLDNSEVKIPMPDSLSWVEKSLRTLHQDELADEFIDTMNHAAERAVPEAAIIFGETIRHMSVEDAQEILTGADDAATQYFRTNTEAIRTEIPQRLRPAHYPNPGHLLRRDCSIPLDRPAPTVPMPFSDMAGLRLA